MKRLFCFVCIVVLILTTVSALADPVEYDLDEMSVDELNDLISIINYQKSSATRVESSVSRMLEEDFKHQIAELFPEGYNFEYPFFGLGTTRERCYYVVSGTVGIHLPDNKKIDLHDVRVVYWYEEETDTYHHVAFFSQEGLYFLDKEAYTHIERYIADDVFNYLREYISGQQTRSLPTEYEISVTDVQPSPTPTPHPTATRKPTKKPTRVPTKTPTKKPTKKPTKEPTTVPTLKKGSKGSAVKILQKELADLGYYYGKISGNYDSTTAKAVKDFQVCNSLKETGTCDKFTWAKLTGSYPVAQRTVYKSRRGKVYHEWSDCSGMKTATAMKLSDALRRGLSPCAHCH